MKLFFTYVDHFPDEKELETLMSSYATFNWEQFRIPINETILEKNILASEDIVVRNR